MFCSIDIGNSRTTFALFRERDENPFAWESVPTPLQRDSTTWITRMEAALASARLNTREKIRSAAIATVVPHVTEFVSRAFKESEGADPLVLSHDMDHGLTIGYREPTQLGMDRLVNMVAARKLYGDNVIVIDMGTACTFTLCKDGILEGGMIIPGLETARDSLAERGAQLPKIDFEGDIPLVGKSTEEAIASGLVHGWASLADGLIRRVSREGNRDYRVICTGGMARLVTPRMESEPESNPHLTHRGIALFHSRVTGASP
jgi:type III pantothenate kinase